MYSGTILKKRLDEALFAFWIMKKHCERMPSDTFSGTLYEQYRLKCLELMKEYAELCADDGLPEGYIWQNKNLLNEKN